MTRSVIEHYEDLLQAGELKPDAAQHDVLVKLNDLQHALQTYRPPDTSGSLLGRLFGKPKVKPAPQGLYIHGHVGRGKTMLMDLFHDALTTDRKLRSHFNDFMQSVHADVHDIRKRQQAGEIWDDSDPIRMAAEHIAKRAHVLCFDEFQVSDITDAMILGRLFESLFAAGVVVVATSNVEPKNLYKNGLNRDAFMPFIGIFAARMQVVSLDSTTDYRIGRVTGREVFITPLGEKADSAVQQLWFDLTDTDHGDPDTIHVKGREVVVPQAARGTARFTFDDLCRANLGAADYIAVAASYSTVFMEHIPVLTPDMRNEAKRFITIIDTLYDRRTRLVASAAAEPADLYPKGPHTFEFDRTVSRLTEMRSAGYWAGKDSA